MRGQVHWSHVREFSLINKINQHVRQIQTYFPASYTSPASRPMISASPSWIFRMQFCVELSSIQSNSGYNTWIYDRYSVSCFSVIFQ